MLPWVVAVATSSINAGGIDYGWKGLVACGCFSTVIIIDPKTARNVQSLQGHKTSVIFVRWAPENCCDNHETKGYPSLASADKNGTVIVWDVINACVTSEFCEPGPSLLDLRWIESPTASRDLLVALYSNGSFFLWDTRNQKPIWKTNVDESFNSFCFNFRNTGNAILCGSSSFLLLPDFPAVSALKDKKAVELANIVYSSDLFGISDSTPDVQSSPQTNRLQMDMMMSECIQACFHGYREECAVFLFKRQILLVDLQTTQPLLAILLDKTASSFLGLYSCRLRDVLICVHENGSLSVYAGRGLASPLQTGSVNTPLVVCSISSRLTGLSHEVLAYDLVAHGERPRRLRHSLPVRFSVDHATEISIAVTAPEGRIQFWQLSSLPCRPFQALQAETLMPVWSMSDLLPHEPGIIKPPKLCLQLCSLYLSSKTDPTACTVCPQYFLKPLAQNLHVNALAAVGNSRGIVQVWDTHSGSLWREYQLFPAPILGIEWLVIYSTSQNRSTAVSGLSRTSSDVLSLCLIVHGWQPKDGAFIGPQSASPEEATKIEVKNYVALLNLSTGCTVHFRDSPNGISPDVYFLPSTLGSSTMVNQSQSSSAVSSYEEPIDLARVSRSGQYLALLLRYTCVELWNVSTLTMMRRIPFTSACCGAVLDWHQSPTNVTEIHMDHFSDPVARQGDTNAEVGHKSIVNSSDLSLSYSTSNRRESLLLCTTLGNLRLVVVDGSEVDSTPISSYILQGLPASSLERITTVTWFADLVAFGTSDGFVVLRDLRSRHTLIRMSSSLGWLDQHDAADLGISSMSDHKLSIAVLSASSLRDTGVRRLRFLPGSPADSLLLTLTHDSLFVWQPREMILLCSAYFRGHLQRCLISADWAFSISGPSDSAICLIVGGDGALRLVRVGESGVEMIPTPTTKDSTSFSNEPMTRFYGSSSVLDRMEAGTSSLVPSLLPAKIAFVIQYLLQNQTWHRALLRKSPTVHEVNQRDSSEQFREFRNDDLDHFSVPYPHLAPHFSKIQPIVDLFFNYMEQNPELQGLFRNPTATIVERCLWTSQLFRDSYAIRFWYIVANRLLKGRTMKDIRYALDLSWDLLTDHNLYRRSALFRLEILERNRTTQTHWSRCVHQLILLGQHERAVSLLLETPPESSPYMINMHRACLLAASASGRLRFSNKSTSTQGLEDTYMSTVKLVATNLLSNGHIDEGIELLCFIGLYPDACRYLESFDKWELSIWLAKCCLSSDEISQVLRRWANYLCSPQVNRKRFAVLIYALLGDHISVLKVLCGLRRYQLAARYLEACLQAKSLLWSDEHDYLFCTIFFEFEKILCNFGLHSSGKCGIIVENKVDFSLP